MKRLSSRLLLDIVIILLGNALLALPVVLFLLPGNLITGGTTGLGLFLHRMTGMNLSLIVLVLNALLFLLGLVVLGKKFAATAILSTFWYPVALQLWQNTLGDFVMTTDPLLCAIFGGILVGVAIGMVIRVGASTGGMDIPPLVIHHLWGLPVSPVMYCFDVAILLLQAMTQSAESILYGILLVMIYTIVLDKCLLMGTSKTELKIISQHPDEILAYIQQEIDRGATILHGQTGYLSIECEILLSVVSNREASRICKAIHSIDPQAFIIISRVTQVQGRGFTEQKLHL